MRLNSSLLFILLLLFSLTGLLLPFLTGLSLAWECGGDQEPKGCGGWRGLVAYCDIPKLYKKYPNGVFAGRKSYECLQRPYSSYVFWIGGIYTGFDAGFYTVDCSGGDCDISPPENSCEVLKALFDPPAPDCNFRFAPNYDCIDGEGDYIHGSGKLKASDGRIINYNYGDPASPVECVNWLDVDCFDDGSPDFIPPDKCWRDYDVSNSDGDGDGDGDGSGGEGNGEGGDNGGNGNGDNGGGGQGNGDGNSGGGNSGGGGNGGGEGEGEECQPGQDCDKNVNAAKRASDALGKFNKDEFSVEKQEGALRDSLERFSNSPQIGEIRNHEYIKTKGAQSKVSFGFFDFNFDIDFSLWSNELEKFGVLLKAIVAIAGVLMILRGGRE